MLLYSAPIDSIGYFDISTAGSNHHLRESENPKAAGFRQNERSFRKLGRSLDMAMYI